MLERGVCFPHYQIVEGGSDAVAQLLVTTGSDVLNTAVIGRAEYEGICPVNMDHTRVSDSRWCSATTATDRLPKGRSTLQAAKTSEVKEFHL